MIHQPPHRKPCSCFLLGSSFHPDFQHIEQFCLFMYFIFTDTTYSFHNERQETFFLLKKGPVHTRRFPLVQITLRGAGEVIQDRFRKLGRFPEAFSSIHYKGTRTYNPPTDFSGLRTEQQLENNTLALPAPGRHLQSPEGQLVSGLSASLCDQWVQEDTSFPSFCQCW